MTDKSYQTAGDLRTEEQWLEMIGDANKGREEPFYSLVDVAAWRKYSIGTKVRSVKGGMIGVITSRTRAPNVVEYEVDGKKLYCSVNYLEIV